MADREQFVSTANKKILWDVVRDTDAFANAAASSGKPKVVELFEHQISHVANSTTPGSLPLTELNKRFLSSMLQSLGKPNGRPSSDGMQQRESLFEERLKKKQSEFYKSDVPPAPKMSFADEEDMPLDVESELQKIQSTRSNDMNQVTFTVKPSGETSATPHLTIDHASDARSRADLVLNKKVSWTDEEQDSHVATFITRLKDKKADVDSRLLSEIKSDLQEIKQMQLKILSTMTARSTKEDAPGAPAL